MKSLLTQTQAAVNLYLRERLVPNWAEQQEENKTIFSQEQTMPISHVGFFFPKPICAGCCIEVLDVWSLNLERMIKASDNRFKGEKETHTQGAVLGSITRYQNHTDAVSLRGSK